MEACLESVTCLDIVSDVDRGDMKLRGDVGRRVERIKGTKE